MHSTTRLALLRRWNVALAAVIVIVMVTSSCGHLGGSGPISLDSEAFAGNMRLTRDEPTIDIPFTLTLDGKAASYAPLSVSAEVVSFEHPSFDNNLLSVTSTLTKLGMGTVTFALTDPDVSAIEVRWVIVATTSMVSGPGIFSPTTPAAVPVLTIDPRTDASLSDPALTLEASLRDWELPTATRFRLRVASPEPISIALPQRFPVAAYDPVPPVQLGVDEGLPITVHSGGGTRIDLPQRCQGPDGCEFDVLATNLIVAPQTLEIHSESSVELVSTEVVELTQVDTFELQSPNVADLLVGSSASTPSAIDLELQLSDTAPAGAIVTIDGALGLRYVGSGRRWHFLSTCCPHRFEISQSALDNASTDARLNVDITIWSPVPVVVESMVLVPQTS